MSEIKKEKEVTEFVVVSNDNETAVFKRNIAKKGRSLKEIKKIEATLPTATLHYFDKDDFDNLKAIEAQISTTLEQTLRGRRKLWEILYGFLDIK